MISVSDLTSIFSFMSTVLDLVGPFISTVFDPAGSSMPVIVCDNLMSVVHCLRLLPLDYQVGICVLIGDNFFFCAR